MWLFQNKTFAKFNFKNKIKIFFVLIIHTETYILHSIEKHFLKKKIIFTTYFLIIFLAYLIPWHYFSQIKGN